MAYDENGRYYFDPEMDVEDRQALDHADRVQAAVQYKQSQQIQKFAKAKMNTGVAKALKEAGMTGAEFGKLIASDPQLTGEIVEGLGYETTKRQIEGARQRDSEGRFVKSGPTARPETKPADKKVTELREEGRQNRVLSDDELIDVLGNTLKGFDL